MDGQAEVRTLQSEAAGIGKYSGLPGKKFAMIMTVAILGALIPAVQPLVLGSLVHEQRLTAAQVGQAATFELLGMAITVALAAAWLPPRRLRLIGAISGGILTVANIVTLGLSSFDVVLVRGIGGICGGMFLWMMIAMLARSELPARWSGLYLGVQSLLALAISGAFTALVIPHYGANGGFAVFAVLSALIVVLSAFLPDRYAALERPAAGSGTLPMQGAIALASVVLLVAASMALWVYIEPLARLAGHGFTAAGTAVTLGTGTQIVGGIVASVLAGRLRCLPVIIWGGTACFVLALLLPVLAHAPMFVAAVGVFGFIWMLVLPFQIPLVIAADPTRRTAMQIGSAQLLGAGAGPALASFAVRGDDVTGVATLIACMFLTSLTITALQARVLPSQNASTVRHSA